MKRLLPIVIAALAAVSCSRTVYTPVPSVRVVESRAASTQRDSLARQDSVYVLERGDTVRIERFTTLYRERQLLDTLRVEMRDTVTVIQEVPAPLSRWERTKMDFGGIAFGAVAVAIAALALMLIRKFKK